MQITEAIEILEAETELLRSEKKKRVAEAVGMSIQALRQWESNLDI